MSEACGGWMREVHHDIIISRCDDFVRVAARAAP
jgi:hypothetical protein